MLACCVHARLLLAFFYLVFFFFWQGVSGQGSGDDAEQRVRVRLFLPEERRRVRNAGPTGLRVRPPHPQTGVGQAEPGELTAFILDSGVDMNDDR